MAGDLLEQHAREKAGMGPEWAIYKWEAIPEAKGSMLTGAVAPPLKAGKRKGKPNWRKLDKSTEKRVFITKDEHAVWEAKWQASTGKCLECEGKGRVWTGWSAAEGSRFKPCDVCDATGVAKVTEGAPA